MALSTNVIFLFGFLSMFSILMVAIPTAFLLNQQTWNPTFRQTDQEVIEFFSLNNITVYDSQAQGNFTFPSSNTEQAGLPSGKRLKIWWDYYGSPYVAYVKALGIELETEHWFLGIWSYWTHKKLTYINQNGVNRGTLILKDELIEDIDITKNGTFYTARSDEMQTTIFYTGNGTETLSNSWEQGHLAYMLSYEYNASKTSINMLTLLGQILTFQAPQLGVSGWVGDLFNQVIAIPIYIITLFVIYKILVGIVPFLSGGSGD